MPLITQRPSFAGPTIGALGALLLACTQVAPPPPAAPPVVTVPPPSGKEPNATTELSPLRIGVYLPLSGAEAAFGRETREGIDLAVERAANSGDIRDRSIELVYADDHSHPRDASNAVLDLSKDPTIVAVLGEVASSRSKAGGIVANKLRVPMLTPGSTNPDVTRVGPFVFRACFDDDAQGRAAAQYLIQVRHRKKLGVLWTTDDLYSSSLARTFREEAERLGATVALRGVLRTETNFSAPLGDLQQQRPEVIYAPVYYNVMPAIFQEAAPLGFSGRTFFGGDGWDSDALPKTAGAEGAAFTTHWVIDVPTAENRAFVEAYRARYHRDPSSLAALGYDAAALLLDAMKRASADTREAVRDALASTRGFAGVTGTVTMGEDRNPARDVVVARIEGGRFRFEGRVRSVAGN
ncbi:ABC transporter substrate-binding protein [Polyangium sp. 6x1]|uniref:ABC transporter substrate-binding protein n=1 Tax=Polyangium sp. 6x1 TaxID=3042689 RepID=UPI00248220B7|nr:ABC transporter substrate-binding protein [Polyangium sp. 6x1]MDI1446286.1 ABC transporter substrate-binding protein [Polyangium sp. 6x1]